MAILTGRKEVAEYFGVSEPTVRDWENHKAMPVLSKGRQGVAATYDSDALDEWKKSTPTKTDQPEPGTTTNADLIRREREIKIQRDELKLRLEAGELVSRKSVESEVETLFNQLRGLFEALPDELATEIEPDRRAEFVDVAKTRVHQKLLLLKSWGEE